MYYKAHKFESFDGTKLYVRESGKGPLLVLIHGAGTDGDFFRKTGKVLSQWFHVISYDRRCHARSGNPSKDARKATAPLDAHAKDVAAIIDAFSEDGKAYVLGHSLGGYIAMRFAELYPEKIIQLVLNEPAFDPLLWPKENKGMGFLKFQDEEAKNEFHPIEKINMVKDTVASVLYDGKFLFRYRVPLEALQSLHPLVLVGEASIGTAIYNETIKLAERLGCSPIFIKGAHNGGYYHPQIYANTVKDLLLG